jgi:CRISPR-associated protein Cas1
MEPFRPLVDLCTLRLRDLHGVQNLAPFSKAALVKIIDFDLPTQTGASPVGVCLERMAQSLADCFESTKADLALPSLPSPLDLSELGR